MKLLILIDQYNKDCEAGAGRTHPQFAGENN